MMSTVSTVSTRVSRHCSRASTNQLLNYYDVYNIYSLYSLYKDFQGLLMYPIGAASVYVICRGIMRLTAPRMKGVASARYMVQ